MTAICIVTPDIVGPVRNGGVGTHCYNLALTLAQAGCRVTVLFTGPMEVRSSAHWAAEFAARGIAFLGPETYRINTLPVGMHRSFADSLEIYTYLRGRAFDVIHFQDWQAAGFHCIQAKRTLGAFAATRLTVTLHGTTEWQAEGMQLWPEQPAVAAAQQYCERYCCEFADVVISPTQHMLDWCTAHGWRLAPRRELIPVCFAPGAAIRPPYAPEPGVVAFFGRLETRKGLEIFVAALRLLAGDAVPALKTVLFVGKIGRVASGWADKYLAAELAGLPFAVEIHANLDTFAARDLIRRRRALVVCPSLLDNCPVTVLECLVDGLPVIAAHTGGIPELLPPEVLFVPEARALADALRAAATGLAPQGAPLYDPVATASAWRALTLEPRSPPVAATPQDQPLVSICVAHYNYGRFVLETLRALQRQTYPNVEIVLVDDGSTDAASRQVLSAITPADFPRLTIEWQENAGPSAARNRAAARAEGRYLVFVDADNVPEPQMVETLLRAARHADLDIVTCGLRHFAEGDPANGTALPIHLYLPLGPALELGTVQNIFGDTNFLVRRDVFLAEGGFPDRFGPNAGGAEDWEFLARAVLRGRRLDVAPEFLVWYRTGHMRRTVTNSRYASVRRVLAQYEAALAPAHPWLFHTLLYPTHLRYLEQRDELTVLPVAARRMLRLLLPFERAVARRLPYNSPIRRVLLKLLGRA